MCIRVSYTEGRGIGFRNSDFFFFFGGGGEGLIER